MTAGLLFSAAEQNPDLAALQIFISLIGKFMAAASFAIIYVYTGELYPTVLRSTATGLCSMFGRVGGVIALLSNSLAIYWRGAPIMVLGIMGLIGGALALLLPETVGTNLPQTIDDALNIGKKNERRGLLSCICLENPLDRYSASRQGHDKDLVVYCKHCETPSRPS